MWDRVAAPENIV